MFDPEGQAKLSENSRMLLMGPMTRNMGGEWDPTRTRSFRTSDRYFPHHTLAALIQNNWSGVYVRPGSDFSVPWSWTHFLYALNASFRPPAAQWDDRRVSESAQHVTMKALTIVCNVLALSVDPVDLKTIFRNSVVVVLIDDTLCMISEIEISLMIPPVLVVAIPVELSSPVIESMRDFMSDNETYGTEVQVATPRNRKKGWTFVSIVSPVIFSPVILTLACLCWRKCPEGSQLETWLNYVSWSGTREQCVMNSLLRSNFQAHCNKRWRQQLLHVFSSCRMKRTQSEPCDKHEKCIHTYSPLRFGFLNCWKA